MKNYTLAVFTLATGLGLALALPASAEKTRGAGTGPCADDVAKFCKDVKPGEGRVQACLKEHEKELSTACSERRALKSEKRGRKGKLSARKGLGDKAWRRGYENGFARGYEKGRKAAGKRGTAKAAKNRLMKVCSADIEKLCGDAKRGEVRDCLIKNVKKLSDDCKTRTEKIKERAGKKASKA